MGGPSAPKILYPKWQNEYQVALLELDRKKLLERVTAAETAIFNRIQAISPEHIAERQAIEDALANLRIIRRENLGLPVKQNSQAASAKAVPDSAPPTVKTRFKRGVLT